jgi:hypothetical protein
MKTLIFLCLCVLLPALVVACAAGLHNTRTVQALTARL